jgi:AcrR family transcriptional regulator
MAPEIEASPNGSRGGGAAQERGRAPGRPLDAARDAAIMAAALEGLSELGYDRLSMEEIAARARAGKGALYRRWPSKAALVVDAVVAWRETLAPTTVADTGSLDGDLDALVAAVPDLDEGLRRQMGVVVGLLTAASRDPELREALSTTALDRPRQMIRSVLDRAVARGEIPRERDLALVPDVMIGLVQVRITLQGEFPDRAFVRRVVDDILRPLLGATGSAPGRKT